MTEHDARLQELVRKAIALDEACELWKSNFTALFKTEEEALRAYEFANKQTSDALRNHDLAKLEVENAWLVVRAYLTEQAGKQ